jgi:hypothetical protein
MRTTSQISFGDELNPLNGLGGSVPHCLMADVDPALEQQVLDITQR